MLCHAISLVWTAVWCPTPLPVFPLKPMPNWLAWHHTSSQASTTISTETALKSLAPHKAKKKVLSSAATRAPQPPWVQDTYDAESSASPSTTPQNQHQPKQRRHFIQVVSCSSDAEAEDAAAHLRHHMANLATQPPPKRPRILTAVVPPRPTTPLPGPGDSTISMDSPFDSDQSLSNEEEDEGVLDVSDQQASSDAESDDPDALAPVPLISRRVDNLYRTHGEGTAFLAQHPLPNSVIVNATQNRAKSQFNTTPSNKKSHKLDMIGPHHCPTPTSRSPCHSDRPMVATSTVVPPVEHLGIGHSLPSPASRPAFSAERPNSVPRLDQPSPDSMVHTLTVQQVIDQARKPPTIALYSYKWKLFLQFTTQTNQPSSPTDLPTILEFLLHLFQKGLSISTLRVYAAVIIALFRRCLDFLTSSV
ncbi:hypothetical protein JRQ81_015997 [Phrynocephalus forsythii]|uniref:Core-binding (CB) domain-containing protein n=1 Tax=Phrynocephalus forsythii TaxID=171643 RepID=A0A9Q1B2L7_9SAUR|nr:hypothetical protein JRQ81_015997 [Phrynocephalus forsythii]